MPRTATIYQIFVSCPSDVRSELQIVQNAVSEWNQLDGTENGVLFEVVSGYTSVAPAFAERPQEVINEEIGDDYDIYIGMMWMAFGADTGEAPSGTVEEFERAFSRLQREEDVYIGFFFKVAPPSDLREMVGAEYQKVQDFKKRVGKAGGFYADFPSDDELRLGVTRLLRQYLKKKGGVEGPPRERQPLDTQQDDGPRPAEHKLEKDMGWLDVQEALTSVGQRLTGHFDWITTETQLTNAIIGDASHELESLQGSGGAAVSDMKPIITRVSSQLENVAAGLRDRLPQVREDLRLLPEITQTFVDVADDFEHDPVEWAEFLEAVQGATQMLQKNEETMAGMISAVRGLPRMTSEFNRSRRNYVDVHEQLMNEVRVAHIGLAAVLERAKGSTQ